MSRSLVSLCLIFIISIAFLSSSALASKKIFVSQADVTKIVEKDVAPVTEKLNNCRSVQASVKKELVKLTKDKDSILDEISLIKKLRATVKSNIKNEHQKHKSKLITLLNNLLKKLKDELSAAKDKVAGQKKKLNKQIAKCDKIEIHRYKYMSAIHLIGMAESSMRYADSYIPQLKAAADEYLAELKELEETEEGHSAEIEAHKKDIKELNQDTKECKQELSELKQDKKDFKTCKNDINIFKKKKETCEADYEKAQNLNSNLDHAVGKLQEEVNELKESANKWKEIAKKYKPRAPPKIPDEDPKPVYKGPRKMCYSTGDPHYRSFTGARFDVYGFTGDYLLAESPDKEFAVVTRIAYGPVWGNRGLNEGVAIKADDVIVESLNGQVKVNGQVKNYRRGRTVPIRNGVTIKRINSRTYRLNTPSGARVQFQQAGPSHNFRFHQVWVYVPNSWVGKAEGLCAGRSPSAQKIKSLKITNDSSRPRLFGTVYNPPDKGHVVTKLKWKSQKFKKQAQEMCFKVLGYKKGSVYHDCLLDAKVSGSLDMLKAYKDEREAVKDMEEADEKFRIGPLGDAYRFFAHLLENLTTQEKQLTKYKVIEELKKMKLDSNIAFHIEGVAARMKREIQDIKEIQEELAERIN